MKYFVNEECIGCGLCADICAQVFSMTDDGVAVAIDEEVADQYLEAAKEAMDSCPVSAIEEK
ncbi:MAG: ferredoxin [Bacillota bacterium]|nr:ferredoxin [Bacillota bacterium]